MLGVLHPVCEDGTVSAYARYEQMMEGVDDYDIRLRALAEAPHATFRLRRDRSLC
jgi:hypothetical protein